MSTWIMVGAIALGVVLSLKVAAFIARGRGNEPLARKFESVELELVAVVDGILELHPAGEQIAKAVEAKLSGAFDVADRTILGLQATHQVLNDHPAGDEIRQAIHEAEKSPGAQALAQQLLPLTKKEGNT